LILFKKRVQSSFASIITYICPMKKSLLSLLSFGVLASAFAQIPNNDFENWTSISIEVPNTWPLIVGKVTKTTDAHSGSFAVRLQGDTTDGNNEHGAVLFGNSNDGKYFYDGFPIAAKPDSLIVWLKYNIAAGDTGLIFLFTQKNGITLSSNRIKITQSASGYTRKAFKINYIVSGQTPDSCILGFSANNVDSQNLKPTSFMQVDDISFSGTTLNVPNPGFENWSTRVHYLAKDWINFYDLQRLKRNRKPNIVRTTDKATGSFAMLVQNVRERGDTIKGYTRSSTNDDYVRPGFPLSGRVDTLYGLYKFLPENGDSMNISIGCYKNGGSFGGGFKLTGVAQNTYAIFKIPITYLNGLIPDSGLIQLESAWKEPKGNSKLFIDNLNFNPVYGVAIDPISKKEMLIVYPNPANKMLRIILPQGGGNYHANITDLRGTVVKSLEVTGELNTVNISELAAGVYSIAILETGATVRFVKE